MGKDSSAAYSGNSHGGISRAHPNHSNSNNADSTPSKLITLMALGYRMEAISILGRNVMQPRGLVGLGYDSLDNCGPEIAEVPFLPSPYLPFSLSFFIPSSLPRLTIPGPPRLHPPEQSRNSSPLHARQRPHRPDNNPPPLHLGGSNRGHDARLRDEREGAVAREGGEVEGD